MQTILYWENVLAATDHPLPPTSFELSEPFWPATRISIAPTLHVDNVHPLKKNITYYTYVGPASSRHAKTFRPGAHIRVGHYVLLHPREDSSNILWIG